jgi:hypothetical protein
MAVFLQQTTYYFGICTSSELFVSTDAGFQQYTDYFGMCTFLSRFALTDTEFEQYTDYSGRDIFFNQYVLGDLGDENASNNGLGQQNIIGYIIRYNHKNGTGVSVASLPMKKISLPFSPIVLRVP